RPLHSPPGCVQCPAASPPPPAPSPRAGTQGHIALHPLADRGQGLPDSNRPAILRLVAHLPPARVVAVLLPPPGVPPRGLDVPVGHRADPHVGPGRGYPQRLYPPQLLPVSDGLAIRPYIAKALARSLPRNSRPLV